MSDPSEVAYWNDQTDLKAAVWSDPDYNQGVRDCLHVLNKWLPDEGVLLDVGAGIGRLAVPFAAAGRWVYAYEPADRMRDEMLGLSQVIASNHLPAADMFDITFAYCVVVLQHLQHAQQEELIGQVAAVLQPDAVLVVQHVIGDADGPGSHHVTFERLDGWVRDAGLTPFEALFDVVRPGWVWMAATK